jgi:hypothetical protein
MREGRRKGGGEKRKRGKRPNRETVLPQIFNLKRLKKSSNFETDVFLAEIKFFHFLQTETYGQTTETLRRKTKILFCI